MTELEELARSENLCVSTIKSDAGETAVLIEAMDDMGDWAVEQDEATLSQRLAAGRLQATGGGA